jgi:RNA polymerase sigma-70 factor (ECF subfamily)
VEYIHAQIRTVTKLTAEVRGSSEAAEPRAHLDEQGFRLLYEQTARPLFAYLLQVSGRRDIADDVLQESYCRLLSAKLPVMDEAQTRSYLFRIASNLLRDRWKQDKHTEPGQTIEAAIHEPSPETATDMRRAFDVLKPRERQLLWLAYVEGANHKEIAHSTGLRAGSVRLLLFRARRKLADVLRGTPSGGKEVIR